MMDIHTEGFILLLLLIGVIFFLSIFLFSKNGFSIEPLSDPITLIPNGKGGQILYEEKK